MRILRPYEALEAVSMHLAERPPLDFGVIDPILKAQQAVTAWEIDRILTKWIGQPQGVESGCLRVVVCLLRDHLERVEGIPRPEEAPE